MTDQMGLTSLQVCVDSPEWFQGTIPYDIGMDSSSSSSSPSATTDHPILASTPPVRPPEDQPLKCPRCDSAHTKFCYYNNYSLTQPRYLCKTCRRYWTKGGTLRNIPVGGSCRKNKKVSSSSKKATIHHHNNHPNHNNQLVMNSPDLQLSYPESSTACNLFGIDFMGGGEIMGMMGNGGYGAEMGGVNLGSPFGVMTLDSINNPFMERGLIGYDGAIGTLDVKPNLLALEWQDDEIGGKSFVGDAGGLGSPWRGMDWFMGMDRTH